MPPHPVPLPQRWRGGRGRAMKNGDFLDMLHRHVTRENKKWTIARLAREIGSGRCHVNRVLLNAEGHGHQTRRKLVALFMREFPVMWRAMVASLGWTEEGGIKKAEGERLKAKVENENGHLTPSLSPRGGEGEEKDVPQNVPQGTFDVEQKKALPKNLEKFLQARGRGRELE